MNRSFGCHDYTHELVIYVCDGNLIKKSAVCSMTVLPGIMCELHFFFCVLSEILRVSQQESLIQFSFYGDSKWTGNVSFSNRGKTPA